MTRLTIPGVRTPSDALDEVAGGKSAVDTPGIELQRFRFESVVRSGPDELLVLLERRGIGRYGGGTWRIDVPAGEMRFGDVMFGGPDGVFVLPPILTLSGRRLVARDGETFREGPKLPKDAVAYSGFARKGVAWVGADRGQVLVSRNGGAFTVEKLEPPLQNSVDVIWVSKDESKGLLFGSSGEAYARHKGKWVEVDRIKSLEGDYAGSVEAIWAPPDESELWIVGPRVMRRRDDVWRSMTLPLSNAKAIFVGQDGERYHAIDGTSADDVWVVGRGGGAFHFDGKTWKSLGSAETDNVFHSVVPLEKNRWLAVSDDGVVIEGDGASITKTERFDNSYVTPVIRARDGSILIEVGGEILQRNEKGWAKLRTGKAPFSPDAAASSKELVSVGMDGRLESLRGGQTAKIPAPATKDMRVAAFVDRDLWVAGDGEILRGTLDGLKVMHTQQGDEVHAIAARSRDDVWFVGSAANGFGLALHWDGKRFQRHDGFQHHVLYGAAVDGARGLYVVGGWGALAHYDGAKWTNLDSGTNTTLQSVLVTPDGSVVAVGGLGTIVARPSGR
jgi:hypothetical protein